jgi:sugar/nucleoside kinase (ribokinase family)
MSPDFLAIGHVAKDLTPDGFRLGGAVTYASLTALRMGLRPAVVTSVGPEVDLRRALPGMPVHVLAASDTTTFVNTYVSGKRAQLLKGVGGPISAADVPAEWRSAPLVLLGPLARELSYDLARRFPGSIVVASIQGWLRQWDSDGRVSPARWDGKEVLPYVDAILSIEDIGDHSLIDLWKGMASALIVTLGGEGARLHFNGKWHHIEAFPTKEVDPTGAGDVFAAAYLIRYRETRDPLESARFASCAASFCVEAEGTGGIPSRAQVEERLCSG